MSLYKELKAAGVPLDNHYSDLYAKVTPESKKIARTHSAGKHAAFSTFRNNTDGTLWYEFPFCFDPYWEGKNKK